MSSNPTAAPATTTTAAGGEAGPAVTGHAQPMRFTAFSIPAPLSTKASTSSYAKSPEQLVWSRRAVQQTAEESAGVKKGFYTLVIHPGSRTLRIGRACDIIPVTVEHAIARRKRKQQQQQRSTVQAEVNGAKPANGVEAMDVDEADPPPPKPPVVNAAKPATITPPSETFARQSAVVSEPQKLKDAIDAVGGALRERMKFYKLHYSANAAGQCASFNADPTNKPEIIADHNDPHRIDWLTAKDPNVVVGDNVWRAGDPDEWLVRWPILKGFNASAYTSGSLHEALGDIEVIWSEVLKSRLNIGRKDYGLYSVMLVVPDIPDQTYIPSMLRLLLGSMGFKQAVIMQESLAATYGAGLSTALVVDVGANATNIACVDEGFVVPDTRISLDVGGDDITELLIRLLARSQVPWAQTADLARVDDFATAERLKIQLATLAEEHVALNLHEFVVRSHGKPAVKCKMKTYEEPALAGMTPFETQGVDYTAKFRTTWAQFPGASSAIDDGFAEPNDGITQAMIFSTQHLAATGMAHIDIPREAAKLPLDVAIFNSARAAGPEDKMRRALTAVLLVGGGLAKIKGVNGALETRLNAIANGRVPGLERVLVVGPTKHVDPRVLCWKGASVFARMDTVQEFWVSKDEWEMVGMRGVRERWWFLS